jgi:hypothetical protein
MKKLIALAVVLAVPVFLFAAEQYDGTKRAEVTADTIDGDTYQWGDSLKRIAVVGKLTALDSGDAQIMVTGEVELAAGQRLYIGFDDMTPDSNTNDTGSGWRKIELPTELRGGKMNIPFSLYSDFIAVDSNISMDSMGVHMATGQSTDNIIVRNIKVLLQVFAEKGA